MQKWLKFFLVRCNFSAISKSHAQPHWCVGAVQFQVTLGESMKKLITRLMAMCFLAVSLAAFAQTGSDASKDNMKSDNMKSDTMKKDSMAKDSKKSAKVKKTSTKKDSMKKDDMKKDDSMKNDAATAPKQ
jgi:pentapeptide MXKDX repeat protein